MNFEFFQEKWWKITFKKSWVWTFITWSGKSQDFVVDDSSIFQSQFRQVNSKFSPTMVDGWYSIFLCQFEQMEKFVRVLNYLFSPFRYRFLKMELYWYNFLLNRIIFCVESQDFEPNLCLDFVRKVRILSKKNQDFMMNLLLADVFIHLLFDESMRRQRIIQYGQFYNLSNLNLNSP